MVLQNTYECMLTLRKNAYGLVHLHLCNGAAASLSLKLFRTYVESCANIVQAVVYRPPSCGPRAGPPSSALPPSCCPPAGNLLIDAVRFKNPFRSTLAHDAVAAAVLHKHHPIIRVGAGLIQFVYGSRSQFANGDYPSQKCIFAIFVWVHIYIYIHTHTHTHIHAYIYIYIRTYMYTYIHTYIYAYAHIYIHISISIAYAHPVASVKQMCTLIFTTSV